MGFWLFGKKTNGSLNSQRERLIGPAVRALMRNPESIVFVKNLDGVYLAGSPAFLKLAGVVSEAGIIGKTDFDLVADQSLAAAFHAEDQEIIEKRIPLKKIENVFPSHPGSEEKRYASTYKYLLLEEDGSPAGILGESRDITDKLRQEHEYSRSARIADRKVAGFDFSRLPHNSDLIRQVVRMLLSNDTPEKALNSALELIGEYYNFSRGFIFEDDPTHTRTDKSFRWLAKGLPGGIDKLNSLPYGSELMRMVRKAIDSDNYFLCRETRQLPDDVRDFFAAEGVQSLIFTGLYDENILIGMLCFDSMVPGRVWDEKQIGTIVVASRLLSVMVARQRVANSQSLSDNFLRALDQLRKVTYVIDPADYSIVFANRSLREKAGEDYSGSPCYKRFMGRNEPCTTCPVRNFKASGKSELLRVRRPDGVCLLCEAVPVHWGGQEYMMINCDDVTEFENKIEQERAMYRNALTHNAAHYYTVDLTDNVIPEAPLHGVGTDAVSPLEFYFPMNYDKYIDTFDNRYKPVAIIGKTLHCADLLQAYEEGRREIITEHYMTGLDCYMMKTTLLAQDPDSKHIIASVIVEDTSVERKKEITAQKALQDRIDILEAMSSIYYAAMFWNLRDDSYYTVSGASNRNRSVPAIGILSEVVYPRIRADYAPEQVDNALEFFDLNTLPRRLAEKGLLVREFNTKSAGWLRVSLIVLSRSVEGTADTCLWVAEQVGEHKKMEFAARAVEKKQAMLLNSISNIYCTIFDCDLQNDHFEALRYNSYFLGLIKRSEHALSRVYPLWLEDDFLPDDREANRDFFDLTKLPQMLKNNGLLTREVHCVHSGWLLIAVTAAETDIDGNVTRFLWMARPIDEQKQRELRQREELEAANKNARAAIMAKSVFLSNMSHDIRTPLNAVIGFATLAAAHPDDPLRVKEYLAKIMTSGNHLARLFNDIINMSRIESGKTAIRETRCDLTVMLQNLRPVIEPQLRQKKLQLDLDTSAIRNKSVLADTIKFNQVLINLLGNAVSFTPENGRIFLRAEQAVTPHGNSADYMFTVKDTGPGMSSDFLEKALAPRKRENGSGLASMDGAVLGVAVARDLVEMMGGSIAVHNQPGQGGEFTVKLTFKLAPAEAPQEENTQPASSAKDDLKILVVDDNEFNRDVAVDLLTDRGIRVETAADGEEAVQKLTTSVPGTYDLVLMDIQMPQMDGCAATRAIRLTPGREDLQTLPILALSANAFEEDKQSALDAGMNAHLAKPLDCEELFAVIRKFTMDAK